MKRIYIAGPSVFNRDIAFRDRLKKKVADAGFIPLYPADEQEEAECNTPDAITLALHIRAKNLALIEQADAIIASFEPFRGPSLDVGTAYEIGYAQAKAKPVFAYSTVGSDYKDRVIANNQWSRPVSFQGKEAIVDDMGMLIEDFGLKDNLMLAAKTDGSKLTVHTGLDEAIQEAKDYFAR